MLLDANIFKMVLNFLQTVLFSTNIESMSDHDYQIMKPCLPDVGDKDFCNLCFLQKGYQSAILKYPMKE